MDGEYIVGDNRARVSERWSLFDSSVDRGETESAVGKESRVIQIKSGCLSWIFDLLGCTTSQ